MSNASSMLNVLRAEVSQPRGESSAQACAASAQALPVSRPQPHRCVVPPVFLLSFQSPPLHPIHSLLSPSPSLSARSFPALLSPLSSDRSLVRLSVRPSPARHVSVRAPSVYVTRDTISPGSQNDTGARKARRRRDRGRRHGVGGKRARAEQREAGEWSGRARERASGKPRLGGAT